MPRCKICKNNFKELYFETERIKICKRCVIFLNDNNISVDGAYQDAEDILRRSMERRIFNDLHSNNESSRLRAQEELDDFENEFKNAIPTWIKNFVSNNNYPTHSKIKKIIRADRLGILYRIKPLKKGYVNSSRKRNSISAEEYLIWCPSP